MGHLLKHVAGPGTTLKMNTEYVKAAKSGRLRCTGTFTHEGKGVCYLQSTLTDAQGDLLALATATWKRLKTEYPFIHRKAEMIKAPRLAVLRAVLAACLALPAAAMAAYPDHVVKVVVPYGPGGGVDTFRDHSPSNSAAVSGSSSSWTTARAPVARLA